MMTLPTEDATITPCGEAGGNGIVSPARKPGRPTSATGRTVTAKGYVLVKQEDGKWVQEHKLVAEQVLGRKLLWTDEVKERIVHIDRDKSNNNPYNLMLETTTRKPLK